MFLFGITKNDCECERQIVIDLEYIYGFVWWGVCKQSRWRHSV